MLHSPGMRCRSGCSRGAVTPSPRSSTDGIVVVQLEVVDAATERSDRPPRRARRHRPHVAAVALQDAAENPGQQHDDIAHRLLGRHGSPPLDDVQLVTDSRHAIATPLRGVADRRRGYAAGRQSSGLDVDVAADERQAESLRCTSSLGFPAIASFSSSPVTVDLSASTMHERCSSVSVCAGAQFVEVEELVDRFLALTEVDRDVGTCACRR